MNNHHGFKVMTKQEVFISFNHLSSIRNISSAEFEVTYLDKADKTKFSPSVDSQKAKIESNHENLNGLIETQIENKNSVLTSFF